MVGKVYSRVQINCAADNSDIEIKEVQRSLRNNRKFIRKLSGSLKGKEKRLTWLLLTLKKGIVKYIETYFQST